ncbi:MAG: hypothetical protein K0U41_00085, partial [Gammaproteobacteria bacterium]|nr:hypothetical protein [Gammaproteobacteria bacterium]
MNFIENTGVVVSTNLGETRESQIANGVSHVDPEAWEAKRYELGDDVLGSDGNVYRYIANNNAIPCKNRGAMDSEFETLDELVDRIRYAYDADVSAGASSGSSTLKTATLSIDLGDKPNPSGYGTFTGQVLVRGNPSWNGGFTFENRLGGIFTSQATIISGQGTDLQLWDLGELDVFFNGQMPTSFFSYLLKLVFNSLNGNASFTLQNSKINYRQPLADAEADLYGYQNPVGADIPTERGFIGDIDWWVLIRANAHNSFFDEKPAVGIGRRGAVQVQVSSETHFDSVALVNCECLEAEVAGNMLQSCQVQGVDNTGNFNTTLFLTLTCIGNAPTSGTGLLDGVITLRSDTKFTWDGIPNQVNNPAILQATRMPNDGANDAMVQRWIVKGAVYDFTRVGEIFIDNAIGETNFTGSFEGMVSYE